MNLRKVVLALFYLSLVPIILILVDVDLFYRIRDKIVKYEVTRPLT